MVGLFLYNYVYLALPAARFPNFLCLDACFVFVCDHHGRSWCVDTIKPMNGCVRVNSNNNSSISGETTAMHTKLPPTTTVGLVDVFARGDSIHVFSKRSSETSRSSIDTAVVGVPGMKTEFGNW